MTGASAASDPQLERPRPLVAAVLVAGGSGQRLGAALPKAFVPVAGRTLLEHAFGRFASHPLVDSVVVVAPAARLTDAAALTGGDVVAGGTTRQESVACGLAAVAAGTGLVLVHDVARPFVPDRVISAVVEALLAGASAVVPVVPIADTVRRTGESTALGPVVDRSTVRADERPEQTIGATIPGQEIAQPLRYRTTRVPFPTQCGRLREREDLTWLYPCPARIVGRVACQRQPFLETAMYRIDAPRGPDGIRCIQQPAHEASAGRFDSLYYPIVLTCAGLHQIILITEREKA